MDKRRLQQLAGIRPLYESDEAIINEFLSEIENNAMLLSEGILTEANIKDIIKNQAAKFWKTLEKVKNPVKAIHDIQAKVFTKLQLAKDDMGKIKQFAKKHEKLVKPAIMVTVIGTVLLGLDQNAVSWFVDNLGSIPEEQVKDILNMFGSRGENEPATMGSTFNLTKEK